MTNACAGCAVSKFDHDFILPLFPLSKEPPSHTHTHTKKMSQFSNLSILRHDSNPMENSRNGGKRRSQSLLLDRTSRVTASISSPTSGFPILPFPFFGRRSHFEVVEVALTGCKVSNISSENTSKCIQVKVPLERAVLAMLLLLPRGWAPVTLSHCTSTALHSHSGWAALGSST